MEGRFARIAAPIAFGIGVLAVWQAACAGFHIPRILLPAPTAIAAAFAANLPMLGADFMQTTVRSMLPGFAIGSAAGFVVALLVDASPFMRRGVLPVASLAGALPIVGIAPIMVMWFGFDWQSKAAVAAVMTFFPMLVNTVAGLEAPGAMERDVLRSYSASGLQTLLKLRLPAALPYIFTALKLNTTLALIGAIVAEFFGTPTVGMGFRISTEAARLDLDVVWAETLLAAITGSALFFGLAYLERNVTFWRPAFQPSTQKELQ
ncbi:MAG TPA: ABC transporter permease [Candidatus Lustribacter sp.]|jgi:NitT/TauT family transport system permease protein|nr:ABC transporter permease [Candidatus Lustribacter sp.]